MPKLARLALLLLLAVSCVLLAVAEFSTLYEIQVITVIKESKTAGAHHGYALLVIAAAAAFLGYGAVAGGARPSAWGLLVLALGALFVVLAIDYPDVGSEGFIGVAFERAEARPKTGFYLESLGAVLLLLCAVATLVLGPREPLARREQPPAE